MHSWSMRLFLYLFAMILFTRQVNSFIRRVAGAEFTRSSTRLYKTNPNRVDRGDKPMRATVMEEKDPNFSPSARITATVILERGKSRLFQNGNPIIYGGAIESIQGDPDTGDEVLICDHKRNLIGRGIFNSASMYRVRLMARKHEKVFPLPINELLQSRLDSAVSMRYTLGLKGVAGDEVYRLVNGEGDGLGGLIVDVIGNVIVAQSSAYWCENFKSMIMTELERLGGTEKNVVWRRAESRLKQDGWHGGEGEYENSDDKNMIVRENDCKYSVNPTNRGQKTGFYCDQRENRVMIRNLSKGKSLLDAFCYSGGFSINAAKGGATSIISVDTSQPALDCLKENIELNQIPKGVIEVVKSDALAYMKVCSEEGKQFDIVICDPPKLAPSRKDLERAKNKYHKINQLGLSLVKPGGLFLTCTCSGAMTQDQSLFKRVIADAARAARRDIRIINTSGAAMDHPVHPAYPEGAYLTAVLAHVN